jgi:hypothetical protein
MASASSALVYEVPDAVWAFAKAAGMTDELTVREQEREVSRPVEDCDGCPALARIRSLGLTVIATARTRPPGTVEVTFVDTPTLLADSDVITVHTPLPPQTNLELRNLHPNRTAALPRAVRTPVVTRNLSPDVAT